MRRGIVGSHKDELSSHCQNLIDEWTAKCLKVYNLTEEEIYQGAKV